jgi:beta-N-acetylhexosaminidase
MTSLGVLMPGFVGTDLPAWLAARLREGLGGVCLFVDNVESPEQLRRLTDAIYEANPRAVVSMDEEGGDVTRIYQHVGSPFPGPAVLGRLDDLALTRAVGAQVGWELRATGVGLALAPDVDVNSNPDNPVIGVRSFGATPAAVAAHAAAWTSGLESTGVAACAKHFPGHGDTAQDSHLALPVVDAEADPLAARELVRFRAAIDAGSRTIMTSHIVVPALDPEHPATFSTAILTDLLRGDWGYDGVIVTDALDMAGASAERGIPAAAVLAVAAGADLLCIGTRNTDDQVAQIAAALDAAVASGDLPAERLADAARRVDALGADLEHGRASQPIPDGFTPGAVPGLTPTLLARAFHVSAEARATLAAHAGRPLAFVALESAANIAVGTAPWGPFARGDVARAATIAPGDDATAVAAALPADSLAVVVGKDIHRHGFARDAVAALRSRGAALVVDMGWPAPAYAGIDIATFGASRLVGAALLDLIGRDTCASE